LYKNFWEGVVRKRRSKASSGDVELETVFLRAGAERVARTFENYMMNRDAQGVLSMFTPPKTPKERDWLEIYVLGGDLGTPGKFTRLFATKGFGYKVLKYDIRKIKIVNASKIETTLEEWRTWWSDGAWDVVPRRNRTHLTLVRVDDQWFVDKYREPSDPYGRHKYGGLGG